MQIHLFISYGAMTSFESLGKNTDKEGTMRVGRQCSGVFINNWHQKVMLNLNFRKRPWLSVIR